LNMSLEEEINELREEKDAVILAHNYQRPQVQDIADFVGDSYGLSVKASVTRAEVIVFCGVDFMAETAAIINPDKKVLLPSKQALCPMAMLLTPGELEKVQKEHPDKQTVLYVNTNARVKAMADSVCTSSNAAEIVSQMDSKEVVFGPDCNLGYYVSKHTDKELIYAPENGFCPTHHQVDLEDVERAREEHPNARVVVHPECQPEVQEEADFIGSTSQIINYCSTEKDVKEFIIGTEKGIIHRLEKETRNKKFYPISELIVCPTMKTITLKKVRDALKQEKHVVEVSEEVREKAEKSINRMLELTRDE